MAKILKLNIDEIFDENGYKNINDMKRYQYL
jgi:hypothetical protein